MFILLLLLHLLSLISGLKAVLVNVTVDDSQPDSLTGEVINFLPTSAWNVGAGCSNFHAAVDPENMLDGTWRDGTYFPGSSNGPLHVTFKFNGTAIYVFGALALETTSSLAAYSNMSFYIDNQIVGHFERVPPGNEGFDYNVSVYSNTSLSPGEHQFELRNGQLGGGGNESLTLFDYIVYSYDNGISPSTPTFTPSTSSGSSKSKRIPVIVGAVVGGVFGAIAVLVLWFLVRRWQLGLQIKPKRRRPDFSINSISDNHIIPDPSLSQNFSSQTLIRGGNKRRAPGPHRELDADPVAEYKDESEEEGIVLPPEYNHVFASSSSQMTSSSAPPTVALSQKSRDNIVVSFIDTL